MKSRPVSYRKSIENSQSAATVGQAVAQRSAAATDSDAHPRITASQAEQRYDFEINSQEDLNEINRLQNRYGVDTIREWSNEGMPREIMGVPKEMREFYETDSTQQLTAPVQRSPKTDEGSVRIECRSDKKRDSIKNLPELTQKIKESKFGRWTKQIFQDLQSGSKKRPNSSKSTPTGLNPQPEQQSIPWAETSPNPITDQSTGTAFPTPAVLPGSISAVNLPSSPLMSEHDSEYRSMSSSISEHDSEYGSTSSSISKREYTVTQPLPQIQSPVCEIEPASTQPSSRIQLPTSERGSGSNQEPYLTDQFNQYSRHPSSQPDPELEAQLQQEAVDSLNTIEIPPGQSVSMYVPGKYFPAVERSVDETKQKAREYAKRLGITTTDPDPITGVATGSAKRDGHILPAMSSGLSGTKSVTFRSRRPPEMRKKKKLVDEAKVADSRGDTRGKKSREREIETVNRSNEAKIQERTKQLQTHLGVPTIAENGRTDAENKKEAISKAQDEMIDAELRTHAAFFNAVRAEKSGSSTAIKQAKINHKAAQAKEKQLRKTNEELISSYNKAKAEFEHPWGPRVNIGSELEGRKRRRKAVQLDNTVYGNLFVSYFKGGKQMERDATRNRAKQLGLGASLLPLGPIFALTL